MSGRRNADDRGVGSGLTTSVVARMAELQEGVAVYDVLSCARGSNSMQPVKDACRKQQCRHEAHQDRKDPRSHSSDRAVVQRAYPSYQEGPGAGVPIIMHRQHLARRLINEDVAAREALARIAGHLSPHPDRRITRAGYIHEDVASATSTDRDAPI